MTRYTVAKGVYPRRGVVEPDKSWQVYLAAAAVAIGNIVLILRWCAGY